MFPVDTLRASPMDHLAPDPVGRFVEGRTFLHWCASPTLAGTVVWGAPDVDDAAGILSLWEYERKLAPGYDTIMDMTGLEWVDGEGFAAVARYIYQHREQYAARTRRVAILLPATDVAGAMIAG